MSTSKRVTWRIRMNRITPSEASPILSCMLTKAFQGGRERQIDRETENNRHIERHRGRDT